jgi:adenylosuccinate lyase
LVSIDQAASLAAKASDLNLERSAELEKELKHDLVAELTTFAEDCPDAGGILHLGATSMDIKDNALVMQQKEALDLILRKLREMLVLLAERIEEWADLPVLGYTHLQAAEPTTLGYRLAGYGQDLLLIYQELVEYSGQIKAKGFTGAVGTSASFAALLGEDNLATFQTEMSRKLGLDFFPVTNQTYPRLQDYLLLSRLAGVGVSLYRLAFDLRVLQSPGFGELAEPFGKVQVGSSAMPFKQNPILSEKINSLGRYLAQLPRIAWDNAAHSLLERTLDDSANQRIYLPEAFLCLDEILLGTIKILGGLDVRQEMIQHNLNEFGQFSGTERLLMELVKAGGDRQEMHKVIRTHAQTAWDEVRKGNPNPIQELLVNDSALRNYLDKTQIINFLDHSMYLGDSEARAKDLARTIHQTLNA